MIQWILRVHNNILEFHKDEAVSYERKNFYLVMSCAAPVLIFIGLVFLFTSDSIILSAYCFITALFSFLIALVASFLDDPSKFSHLFCVLLNFFIIPSMFFMSDGVYFGMVLFFILGVVLTMVLLGRQKYVYAIVIFEVLFDIALIFYSYLYDGKVYIDKTDLKQEIAISLAFVLVAVTIIFLFIYQNYIHRSISLNIEKDNEAIAKAENTKGRFLANMTHEIRTPMNAIIGMTDLMLKENLSQSSRELTDTIKSASSQLLQIINNILEFSKLDSGRAELINNEYSFRKMLEEIVDGVSTVYSAEDISLHFFLSKDIPDRLFGDDVRIKQVLRYLLFSPLSRNTNGSVNLSIDFDYDDINCIINFKFRIASTGSGLTEDEIKAIYNAYSNYDSRQKTDYNRTGLEISICKKILNMMNGDLSIESIEGIGNAVQFSFTNYVVDEKPIVEFVKEGEVSPLIYIGDKSVEYSWQRLIEEFQISATYVKSPISFRGLLEKRNFTSIYIPDNVYPDVKEYIEAFDCEDKVYVITSRANGIGDFGNCRILRHPIYLLNFLESIDGSYDVEKYKNKLEIEEIKYPYARVLCVDDTTVNLIVLNNLLKEYDITATTCGSGKEALDILENSEFDLFIIDQKMPEMDGTELLDRIKNLSNANRTVPAVCATADFGANIKEQLEKAGFDDYLAKPINAIYLERVLKTFLPEELRTVRKINVANKKTVDKIEAPEPVQELDPLEFSPSIGIGNLGGSKEAYISVLLAYYEEGLQKIKDVPEMFAAGDISLYTTNVHALKSSSATVGCMGISPMFKALEFAGKDNNTDYINDNSAKVFDLFIEVLEKVREYLEAENALVLDEEETDDSEAISLDKDILVELKDCVSNMNLRRCEEIISNLSTNNYGGEINGIIKKIKSNYENFEYFEMKTLIEELL